MEDHKRQMEARLVTVKAKLRPVAVKAIKGKVSIEALPI